MITLSTLLWCPKDQNERALIIGKHLECIKNASHHLEDKHGFKPNILIVNNDVEHDVLLDVLYDYLNKYQWEYKCFSPQLGWARGRNFAMEYFMSTNPGPEDRLVVSDCDQLFDADYWLSSIHELATSDPDLHAYMLRPDKYSRDKKVRLKSGTVVSTYGEWLGTSNVMSPVTIDTIGGYNHVALPADWGFHDAEYGRRLKKSGLLDCVKGMYVDPVDVPSEHGDSTAYNEMLNPLKMDVIKNYNMAFAMQEHGINTGEIPVYFEYRGNYVS